MICLVLSGKTLSENLGYIKQYRSYIQIVELRADFLDDSEFTLINRFPEMTDLPVILTIRKREDGGHWRGREKARIEAFQLAASSRLRRFSFMDLEEALPSFEWEKDWIREGGRIIRSFHDFNGVPMDLAARLENLPRVSGEIPKAAVTPLNTADLLNLLRTTEAYSREDKIVLGMGDIGIPTRILSRRLGSFLTFCSPSGISAAPGHINPESMEKIYHFSKIDNKTRLFGIIGNPVMHTLSPGLHNRGYELLKTNCLYIPFQIDDPDEFLKWAVDFGFEGFSVTVPHKERVIPLLRMMDESVKAVLSCNTLIRSGSGWSGHNTDIAGFLSPLQALWGVDGFKGRSAIVLGAGGAARAVVHALASRGVAVTIYNRTSKKAEDLAALFNCRWGRLDDGRGMEYADLIVQTTILGMFPVDNEEPVSDYIFSSGQIAYDLIYTPEETLFLSRARLSGCRIINGMEMLVQQGKAQFLLFTGRDYPEDTVSS